MVVGSGEKDGFLGRGYYKNKFVYHKLNKENQWLFLVSEPKNKILGSSKRNLCREVIMEPRLLVAGSRHTFC